MSAFESHLRIIEAVNAMSVKSNVICVYSSAELVRALNELGGSDPVYTDIMQCYMTFHYEVSFGLPTRENTRTMVQVTASGCLFEEDFDAMQSVSLAALKDLQDEHRIHVLDYNYFLVVESKAEVASLADTFRDSKNNYQKMLSHGLNVFEKMNLVSDRFVFMATELEISKVGLRMVSGVHEVTFELKRMYSRFTEQLASCGRFVRAFELDEGTYSIESFMKNLHLDDTAETVKVSTNLRSILRRVTSKIGLEVACVRIEESDDNGYIGFVDILTTGVDTASNPMIHTMAGKEAPEPFEAECTAMFNAIRFLCGDNGLSILNISYHALCDIQRKAASTRREL